MIRDLEVPYADTRAEQLRLSLSAPPRDAEISVTVATLAGLVELRVLRASHQVLVHRPTGDPLIETVSCDGDGLALQRGLVRTPFDDLTHAIEVDVLEYDDGELATVADRLTRELTDDRSVVGRFPGHPHAITALRLDSDRPLRWSTWHCYPQAGQVVRTRTTVRLESPGDPARSAAAAGATTR